MADRDAPITVDASRSISDASGSSGGALGVNASRSAAGSLVANRGSVSVQGASGVQGAAGSRSSVGVIAARGVAENFVGIKAPDSVDSVRGVFDTVLGERDISSTSFSWRVDNTILSVDSLVPTVDSR